MLTTTLWFAFNFSSFYLCYQHIGKGYERSRVVICFQFQFFLSLLPTQRNLPPHKGWLWFAFNFSSFYLCYQLWEWRCWRCNCCDLLSISVLSIFVTNIESSYTWASSLWFAFNFSSFYLCYQQNSNKSYSVAVVICFQFQFFLSLLPTDTQILNIRPLLWFAFNFSSFYLCYQPLKAEYWYGNVVICFQFQFFLSLLPTFHPILSHINLLWFAFNFSSFYLCYQHLTV